MNYAHAHLRSLSARPCPPTAVRVTALQARLGAAQREA